MRDAMVARETHCDMPTRADEGVRALLNPGSVAVIGASRDPASIGGALLANLINMKFRGTVYPVNPNAIEILGLRAYPSVRAIGKPVDLAMIVVPAALVESVLTDCAACGVRGAVVITSGFAESGPKGRELERRITAIVRAAGMRMVGPNCMGVINTDPDYRLNATFAPIMPRPGNIGILSQSGALGLVMLEQIQKLNLGISTFVSAGNKADVSGNDLLAYWANDPRTDVIMLYLESFGNPLKFARIAPEVVRKKPVIAVKSGRSAAGTRAASSHSAALASLDIAVDALFEQAGVIRTNTLQELFDLGALLSTQPIPKGPGVGVVTNAGGPGILLADACEARGLVLPPLSEATLAALRSFLPPHAGLSNPVDMAASANTADYASAIEAVGNDPKVDSVIVVFIPPLVTVRPEDVAQTIAAAAGRIPKHKPVLSVFMSSRGVPELLSSGRRGQIPAFAYPEEAALALAAAHRLGVWRRRPTGRAMSLDADAVRAIRKIVDRALSQAKESVWLSADDLAAVMHAAGIPYAESRVCTVATAAQAAHELGYPLVAKAIAPGVVHKSDIGGVIMGLRNSSEVASAASLLAERMKSAGAHLDGVLLQREVAGGIEALVGVTMDPTFGPLVVCGMGGVQVELLKDVAFRLTPVTDVDAAELVGKLRSAKLLEGYRGSPPGDRAAVESMITRVSALVDVIPELQELDLNPVKVLRPGEGVIAVDGRMRIGAVQPAFSSP